MAELKTKRNTGSVQAFLDGVEDPHQRRDARAIARMMREVTGQRPAMWGDSVVGFGSYRYRYASGREGDWFVVGLSPRKTHLSLYLMCDLSRLEPLMARLGRHKRGVGCLYIKRLADVDRDVLRQMIERTVEAAGS